MKMILSGIGGCLAPEIETNADISAALDARPEWIERMTGITERRKVSEGLSTRDLAIRAGARALVSAGISDVDAVIVATCSPDRITPAVAPEVAQKLGVGQVAAFDINSGCSGFLYGLATAAGFISAGIARRVLLIGAEAYSVLVNPVDRTTRPIFGDGAGAVVLRAGEDDEDGTFGPIHLGSDGELCDLLSVAAGGSRHRSRNRLGGNDTAHEDWYLKMDGRAVYGQAVARMAESARQVLTQANWNHEDLDWFVAHQANARILRTVGFELGLPDEKVPVNIGRIGNTLTASIPLLLLDLANSGRLAANNRVLLGAFGAGLAWGATVLKWPDVAVSDVEWLAN
jgi:3-oxoacyl-[acyl-carrier-protein] synthase-3